MDILSFALYHENTKVVVDDAAKLVSPDLGQKRRREEHDVTDSSKENDAQRRRRPGDVDGAPGPEGEEVVRNEHGARGAPSERREDPGIDRACRAGRHL